MNKNKRILVTGANGLVGVSMLQKLVSDGWTDIVATYHNSQPKYYNEAITWKRCDLTKRDDCDMAVIGCHYVVHTAAFIGGAVIMQKDPLSLITNNNLMNLHMLESSYNAMVEKFIGFGSSTAYPEFDGEVTEDMIFDGEPWDKYYGVGWVKKYYEALLKFYSTKLPRKMVCVSIRPSNIYGPNDKFDPDKCHVLPATIRKIIENDSEILVWGDGTELRDLIYVDDICDAILMSLEKCNCYNAFNIGSGRVISVNDLISEVMNLCGKNLKINYDLTKPTMIKSRRINCDKAKEILGFSPSVSLIDGLTKTIVWYETYRKELDNEGF